MVATCGAMVRGTYGTPEAGTRTAYALYWPVGASCPEPSVRTARRRPVRVRTIRRPRDVGVSMGADHGRDHPGLRSVAVYDGLDLDVAGGVLPTEA